MAVVSVNIGEKRVHVTAYCPSDALGLLCCDFVLGRVTELLDDAPPEEVRGWLIEQDNKRPPERRMDVARLFELLDAGYELPQGDAHAVDPMNIKEELRIVAHLLRERKMQRH